MFYQREYSPFGFTLEAADIEKLNSYSLELGPIRPPSEGLSLLIRVTRNCPWNRCAFCPTYKGQKFQLRTVEEIVADIETAREISQTIKAIAGRAGYGDEVREIAAFICGSPQFNSSVHNVALWLYAGGETAFLQDANSLSMPAPQLVRVVKALKEAFPGLTRITSYARSHTAARRSLAELEELRGVGLTRLHIGLESGHDPVLDYMQKGVSAEEHIRGGRKVKEAGISLSFYVMPGLGGKKWSPGHVADTARVLNAVDPDFIRLRSLLVRDDTLLLSRLQEGDFQPLGEDEVVEEIGELIERLECHSQLISDHVLNLLSEVEGNLPQDKERLLSLINRYLALPAREKLLYRLGQRAGYYRRLDDLQDPLLRARLEPALKRLDAEGMEEAITALKKRFV